MNHIIALLVDKCGLHFMEVERLTVPELIMAVEIKKSCL